MSQFESFGNRGEDPTKTKIAELQAKLKELQAQQVDAGFTDRKIVEAARLIQQEINRLEQGGIAA
jgi:hypothetical protein